MQEKPRLSAWRAMAFEHTSSVLRNVVGRTPKSSWMRRACERTWTRNSSGSNSDASEWCDVSARNSTAPVAASRFQLSITHGAHCESCSSAVPEIENAQRNAPSLASMRRSRSSFIGR